MPSSLGIRLHLKALGVPILIRVYGDRAEELGALLDAAWSRCSAAPDEGAVEVNVAVGSPESLLNAGAEHTDITLFADLDAAMDAISPLVTTAAIGARAGQLLMLHACAVAHPLTGRTVALVGPSGAGKTTAVRALAKDWGYVTDETVGIRPDLSVLPYPKPLSVISGPTPFKQQVSPDHAGLRVCPGELRLAGLLILDRHDQAQGAHLTRVSTVYALAEVAEETSHLAQLDTPLHQLAAAVSSSGSAQRVTYRDAEQLRNLVGSMLADS